ncbi:HSP20-like chaperone [Apodospora peruviana]|uniref:HSP20-like chaperone n=1 Tax=Apodospora peruviana TaxID=516989 RepID=A0AAE0HVR3_9PEZI|nr:HSP20-like chaperone [Apodospora peruviana]
MVFTLPDNLYSTDPNFTTLFRLLDDFDSYSREVQNDGKSEEGPPGRHGRYGRGLYPRFDIRETKEAYELYGELPGIDRKDVHIELNEPNQLLIRGHAERGYDVPHPPSSKKKEGEKKDEKEKEKEKEGEGSGNGNATLRFLQKERQVGNFAREFAFPGPLSEFDISASMENGILKVVAPKATPSKGRRIEIS